MKAERAGVAGDGFPVLVDQDKRTGGFVEDLSGDGFHFRSENELNALL